MVSGGLSSFVLGKINEFFGSKEFVNQAYVCAYCTVSVEHQGNSWLGRSRYKSDVVGGWSDYIALQVASCHPMLAAPFYSCSLPFLNINVAPLRLYLHFLCVAKECRLS